jgi:phage-related minor tail protein
MLYLAQVQKNQTSGEMELQLLAHLKSESNWESSTAEIIPLKGQYSFNKGELVAVEFADDCQIVSIKDAKELILNLMQQQSNKTSSNPHLLEEERIKVEQWRQEITSQSLELNRRALEVETHREQLQELEQTLKQDREKLIQEQEKLKQEQTGIRSQE